MVVHQFILDLLDIVFADEQVKTMLYEDVLLEKLQSAYEEAMNRSKYLLRLEREGKPTTLNDSFNAELQKNQTARLKKSLGGALEEPGSDAGNLSIDSVMSVLDIADKSNPQQVREYLHDILKSYYKVSAKRFVDVVCQQVVNDLLLDSESSPLHIFNTDLVFDLSADTLDNIAGDDVGTKQERDRLSKDIDNLQAAMKVLRGS